MVRTRPALPAGHGEVLAVPAVGQWHEIARRNHATAREWGFDVDGMDSRELRERCRETIMVTAAGYSARIGIPIRPVRGGEALLVVTGHQPELYHPGVWVKDFLVQRLADELDGDALDVIVDTDGFDSIAVTAPCLTPGVERCRQYLAVASEGQYYASAAAPSADDLASFCEAADSMLASLPAPAVRRHFAAFCETMRAVAPEATTLAELVTFARRRYEATAGTDYHELPVTALARHDGYLRFAADVCVNAQRFAACYNAELDAYRVANNVRSVAQPLPDLEVRDDRVELPFWALVDGRRRRVFRDVNAVGHVLVTESGERVHLPEESPAARIVALSTAPFTLAPKALALTAFTRLFVADLFIHGVGGGRYDRVTDGIIRRYYGIEPPQFVVASMTMYLPLGAHVVSDEELASAKDRLNRLEHNPDALLAEVEFDSPGEQARAVALAREKSELVSAIAKPDADKKALGMRIREVNSELSTLLEPLRAGFEAEVRSLEAQHAVSEVLTDRTYPFCLWDPAEIADKVR